MSQSNIYDLARNNLEPGPSLSITKGNDSMLSGKQDFRCVKGDLESEAVQNKLKKGTRWDVLYPDIGAKYGFMSVDTYDSDDEEGGFSVVTVRFKGVETSDDSQNEGDDVTYSRNNALHEESIFNNPNYIAWDAVNIIKEAIRLSVKGVLYAPKQDEPYNLYYLKGGIPFMDLTDPDGQWWYDYIVTKGNHTWNAPVSEWTKSATGKRKLSGSDLADYGWIDTPPGEPAAPDGHKWQFSGATESITLEGDGANSYSLTWTSGRFEERVYTKPSGGS